MNRLIAKAQAEMPGNFGRYKKEEPHAVRTPETTATAISDLRKKREMLRKMKLEDAKTMIEVRGNLNFFEALELAKKEGKIIVPNDIHDRILLETGDIDFLRQLYRNWIWTGSLVIYEAPDNQFKDKVVFGWREGKIKYSISFTVPEQFRGKTNCALLVEHPDFGIQSLGNNNYELKANETHLIQNFPKADGWYKYDELRIPIGKAVAYRKDHTIRHLWRASDSYIGPLGRDVVGDVGDFGDRRYVGAYGGLDGAFGVALF